MERIFTNPCDRVILENIFENLEFEDIVALADREDREKRGCELINKWCYHVLNDPIFWLKKWTKNGLTKTDRVDWIRILALAKITKQEEDVLKFIKKVIQIGNFVSVPCFIKKTT